jgi:NAD(P) transhydrogenase subunit beta
MTAVASELAYLVAGACFIVGLKWLSSPQSARAGNLLAASGMLVAVVATLLFREILSFEYVLVGIVVGSAIGAISAHRVQMTAMPQMVAIFNGVGGGASALVAWAEYLRLAPGAFTLDLPISIAAATIIGGVTFSGSLIAFAKLQELISGRPVTYPFQQVGNLLLALAIVGLSVHLVAQAGVVGPLMGAFVAALALALVLGVVFVLPIGGADMPVVISLLNAFSGLAAAAAGFVLNNHVLIVSGALVGSSGIILTRIMCWAMNRSLSNVLFGAFGAVVSAPGTAAGAAGRSAKAVTPDEVAILLAYARAVIIAPGYGLAVSRAQNEVRDLARMLESRGVDVKYAIHPVAGRMPGHMNVLLAEADISYDRLYDMEEINREFPNADVALVLGANDVVNPAARHDTSSPLYGMPILDVDKAKHVIVIKRSLAPGFAGVDNELFYLDHTRMFFADGKAALVGLMEELKKVD